MAATALMANVSSLRAQVPDAGVELSQWRTYNHRLSGVRFSALAQISTANVNALEEVCRLQLAPAGSLSAGPVMVDGVLFVTMNNLTLAIDARTCLAKWRTEYLPEQPVILPNNRGAAYAAGRVFRGTGDGRLLAYDATTGTELWRTKIGDPTRGEFASAAPIAWDGLVFLGLSGGELGVRGRMMAFDASSGAKRWSFDLVPGPGQFGADSWAGASWRHGGGATFSSYSLDERRGELFVSVDNPAPAFAGAARRGSNLFTDSVLALDAKTGRRRWHLQLLKHDTRDYGAAAPAVLFTAGGHDLIAQGAKDGHLYVIDRATHRLVFRTAVTTIGNSAIAMTAAGTVICPGISGGLLYNSPSFDPDNQLLIAGSVDWCSTVYLDAHVPHYQPLHEFAGARQAHVGEGSGWITAVDALDGRVRWRVHTGAPIFAAVTSTAGGLTFTGDHSGQLYALRSRDGTQLWSRRLGGSVAGGLITYQIEARQYLAVLYGNATLSSPTAAAPPTLIIYALPVDERAPRP